MSIKTSALVIGKVIRVSSRTIPATKDREALTFTNVLVLGGDTLADVGTGRDVAVPNEGEFIIARVEVGVYRDDDQLTITEYLDAAYVAKLIGVAPAKAVA